MKRSFLFALVVAAGVILAAWMVRSCIRQAEQAPGQAIEGVSRATEASARRAAGVFVDLFNLRPEVHISDKVVQQQSCPIAEFAVIEREYFHRYVWRHRWLGSEKVITLEGVFKAKAGFDLKERFVVRIDPANGRVVADLPPVRILSVEQKGDINFTDESGLWNRVQSGDRQQALNEFEHTARAKVEGSGLMEEAGREAMRRLQELADRNRSEMIFYFRKPDAVTPAAKDGPGQ